MLVWYGTYLKLYDTVAPAIAMFVPDRQCMPESHCSPGSKIPLPHPGNCALTMVNNAGIKNNNNPILINLIQIV